MENHGPKGDFMPVISRRVSLLLLLFAFFLLLAPALFSSIVFAQDATSMNLPSILPAATQGGIGVIMLIVYLAQARKDKQDRNETNKLFADQLKDQNETTKSAFKKNDELTQQLIQLLKDEQEYKEALRGTLERILVESKVPTKCPILVGKKINIEVSE